MAGVKEAGQGRAGRDGRGWGWGEALGRPEQWRDWKGGRGGGAEAAEGCDGRRGEEIGYGRSEGGRVGWVGGGGGGDLEVVSKSVELLSCGAREDQGDAALHGEALHNAHTRSHQKSPIEYCGCCLSPMMGAEPSSEGRRRLSPWP